MTNYLAQWREGYDIDEPDFEPIPKSQPKPLEESKSKPDHRQDAIQKEKERWEDGNENR